jgi:hypothetical protein
MLINIKLFSILLEDNTCVVTTEAERVGQRSAHLTFLRLVEREVQLVVELGIIVALLMVDGRRHESSFTTLSTQNIASARHRQHPAGGLSSTLGRRDVDL